MKPGFWDNLIPLKGSGKPDASRLIVSYPDGGRKDRHAGARHCPLVHLGERYPALPADRTLIISDWAMKQSPAAAKFLTRKGYKVAGVLRGGMERWQAERLPVEQRTPGPGLDLPETADRD